ncbi:MAG: hypothetical protein UY48_C0008G0035 [Candidatus Gottesmanbacteria bacterium GW2011_GWB1_49_7]|uniref:Uncharacterized protein n=1 Tax=Candidatus Gottesmanbacteria bacterium GW2011_GWB1_49_7 TaxID=1618448 RepID=A0A0G1W2Q8_9BACT|nr:MAG: hypothetical protein UY48_C0008G0035 [Candidatus Gottesmanbacteria bacterium GW2011_GWB1_49_7]
MKFETGDVLKVPTTLDGYVWKIALSVTKTMIAKPDGVDQNTPGLYLFYGMWSGNNPLSTHSYCKMEDLPQVGQAFRFLGNIKKDARFHRAFMRHEYRPQPKAPKSTLYQYVVYRIADPSQAGHDSNITLGPIGTVLCRNRENALIETGQTFPYKHGTRLLIKRAWQVPQEALNRAKRCDISRLANFVEQHDISQVTRGAMSLFAKNSPPPE